MESKGSILKSKFRSYFASKKDVILGNGNSSELSEKQLKELADEGFPIYMVYAFLKTAEEKNCVVISRVPGGAGTPLIDESYDLKGFHVKSKSCNWGPMAGFLCQLPYLNKVGSAKISYNTDKIAHYLTRLDAFKPVQKKIEDEKKAINSSGLATEDEKKASIIAITKHHLTSARALEPKTGEWTGENTIEEKDAKPFIHLKRKFTGDINEVLQNVRNLEGVDESKTIIVNTDRIYGIARNVSDKDQPTVEMHFYLVPDNNNNDIWKIYHEVIKYKAKKEDPSFNKLVENGIVAEEVEQKVKDNYTPSILKSIFTFASDNIIKTQLLDINGATINIESTFYPLMGLINPFPPYRGKSNDEYYKNAVTGDYDLFAIWPHEDIPFQDLIRISEITRGKEMRLGGKIFTLLVGNQSNFGIEFIPTFGQLNANEEKGILGAENLDYGNPHNLTLESAQILNQFAASFYEEFHQGKKTGNKAFHSDEGGRPGIMEIEWPVAVFLPERITKHKDGTKNNKMFKSKALNNLEKNDHDIQGRSEIEISCGLIKNISELVAFILECQKEYYRVMMNSDWMIHLFYCSLTEKEKGSFHTKYNSNTKKLKEFKNDIGTKDENNPGDYYDQYLSNLKTILNVDTHYDYQGLRDTILSYAFPPNKNKTSFEKRREVEDILINE